MAEQILLLKLLTIPVKLIKFVSRTVSVVTYLPNYILILVLDSIIFNPNLQSSFVLYCLLWPFRFIALNLVTLLFCSQFFAIYHFLDIYQKSWYTQILAMFLALGGLLFLMRKGYLRMITSFNPVKLKSPLEHIQIYYQFLLDIIGIILSIINILLLSNAHKTLSYQYISQRQLDLNPSLNSQPFITHIKRLIHSSLLYNLTFFYVKIFFKVFTWRYNHNLEFVEKEENNILNLLVLLSLLFLQTLLDIVVVGVLGWICILHWKRIPFKTRLRLQEKKYKVAINHVYLIFLQILQLIITAPWIAINSHATVTHLKLLLQLDSQGEPSQFTSDKYLRSTLKHIYYSLIKIPAYFSLLMIFVFQYKYKKLTTIALPEIETAARPVQDFDVDLVYMKLFKQQMVDAGFLPFIVFCTIVNPLCFNWLRFIINDDYDLQRDMILHFFTKSIIQLVLWIPAAILLTLVTGLYSQSHIFLIIKGYYFIFKTTLTQQYVRDQSQWKKYSYGLLNKLYTDLPFLPLYFISTVSFLKIFDNQVVPNKVYDLFQKFLKMFYLYRVKSSPRSQAYFQMFNKDLASGLIQNQGHKMRFWKFAHKCERHIFMTKCLQLLVPQRKYDKKLAKMVKEDHMSSISNEYWYRLNITKKMLQILVAFMIEVVVGLFGLLVLAPLTLWRLPTFIMVFNLHRSKIFFFKVLFSVYKLMVFDLLAVWVHTFAFIVSPVAFVKFRLGTIFRYGKTGVEELLPIQAKKNRFIVKVIILQTLKVYTLVFEIIVIHLIYLRKHSYLKELKMVNVNFDIIKKCLRKGPQIPTIVQLIDPDYKFEQIKFGKFKNITKKYFQMSLIDLPYFLIAAFCLLIMPWRYFYLKKAVKQMRQDEQGRRQVIKVIKKVFNDYLCIFLSIVLLFSGVKTIKAIKLMRRNYRLNFFVGFLKYSFLKELTYQLKQAAFIYFNVLLLMISLTLDWQHSPELITRLYTFYKQYKENQQTKRENQKIYKNTVRDKKDLRLLDQIGFNEYVTLCQFLDIKDLMQLTRVNKMNYMMLDREEIWIQKWENCFSAQHQNTIKGDTFKMRCIKAYQVDTLQTRPTKITFNELSRQLFLYHIYETKTNIPQAVKPLLPLRIQQKVYKNYQWSIHQGYGPDNELPQEEDEDEEFLRLTNQVRRQKVWLINDYDFYFDHLFSRPIEIICKIMNGFYGVDSHRRKKQLIYVFSIVGFFMSWIYYLFKMLFAIFMITKWTAVLIILLVYSFAFATLLYDRLSFLYISRWITLRPFNLYTDVRDAIMWVVNFIRIKILQFKSWLNAKLYAPVKSKVLALTRFISRWLKKKVNFVVAKVKYASKVFMDKIAVPLYISCVKNLVMIKNIIIGVFRAAKNMIVFVYNLIHRVLQSFYQALVLILKNLNKLYFSMLFYSRKGLMKLGMLGQLIFTLFGLGFMLLPSIFCYFVYSQRWYIIVSTVHSAILMVMGYKHLNKIKTINQ